MHQDLEASYQPTETLKGMHAALLVIAFVLTIASAGVGLLMFVIANMRSDHNFFHKIVWLAPVAGVPLFLLVFVSRRMLSWAMWPVWILCCVGVLGINLKDRVQILFAILPAVAVANVNWILLLTSALIVQCVASSETQRR